MKWPSAAGDSRQSRSFFMLVALVIFAVLVYLVVTFVLSNTTSRAEEACAFARAQIREEIVRVGTYRGSHPCEAMAQDGDALVWRMEGVYRTGLVREIQPNIPFDGVVVWNAETEAFEVCAIDFWRAGEDSTDIETIRPESPPSLCPQ